MGLSMGGAITMKTSRPSNSLGPAFSLSDLNELKCVSVLLRVDFPNASRGEISDAVIGAIKASKLTYSRKHILETAREALCVCSEKPAVQAA